VYYQYKIRNTEDSSGSLVLGK